MTRIDQNKTENDGKLYDNPAGTRYWNNVEIMLKLSRNVVPY